jgi:hypothetical protein
MYEIIFDWFPSLYSLPFCMLINSDNCFNDDLII